MKQSSNWVIAFLTFANLIILGYSILRPFDKEELVAGAANELYIQQYWGNLNYYHYFHLRNIGEKQGVITSFDGLIVSKDNSNFKRYFTAKYSQDNFTGNYYPIVNITLNKEDIYNGYIQMLKEPNKENKDSVSYYISKKMNEIESLENNAPSYDYKPKQLSRKTYEQITNFITRGYSDLREGEYQYVIAVTKNNELEPFYLKAYSFVLYRADLDLLNEGIKNYSKDGGAPALSYLRSDRIRVQLTEIKDEKVVNSLAYTLKLTK